MWHKFQRHGANFCGIFRVSPIAKAKGLPVKFIFYDIMVHFIISMYSMEDQSYDLKWNYMYY